ncbi:Oleate hydratase [Bienertia sinuspersici]
MNVTKNEIKALPIWVQLHGLDIKYWVRALFKIFRQIGKPIRVDAAIAHTEKLMLAGVLVEVGVNQTLADTIQFLNEHDLPVSALDILLTPLRGELSKSGSKIHFKKKLQKWTQMGSRENRLGRIVKEHEVLRMRNCMADCGLGDLKVLVNERWMEVPVMQKLVFWKKVVSKLNLLTLGLNKLNKQSYSDIEAKEMQALQYLLEVQNAMHA